MKLGKRGKAAEAKIRWMDGEGKMREGQPMNGRQSCVQNTNKVFSRSHDFS